MADFILNEVEVRVLGALLEKGMATPEYYPLSLNGLTNACNQKSNRDPVVAFDESTVVRAIDGLKEKQMVVLSEASRVPKYAECFGAKAKLIDREAALICLLLLRGPQTVGELRGRSGRLYSFADIAEVEETLENLADMDMVSKLTRQPGRKESRYTHLLAGEPDESLAETGEIAAEKATLQVRAENERIATLEQEITALNGEVEELKRAFHDFKAQFD